MLGEVWNKIVVSLLITSKLCVLLKTYNFTFYIAIKTAGFIIVCNFLQCFEVQCIVKSKRVHVYTYLSTTKFIFSKALIMRLYNMFYETEIWALSIFTSFLHLLWFFYLFYYCFLIIRFCWYIKALQNAMT